MHRDVLFELLKGNGFELYYRYGGYGLEPYIRMTTYATERRGSAMCVRSKQTGAERKIAQKGKDIDMKIKEFALKVQDAVVKKLGEDYQVKIQEVQKNNDIILEGLMIISEKNNISPTIYLNPFWEAYEKGIPFSVVINRILQIYAEDTPKGSVDMSFFRDFTKVKDRICYRLVSKERNKELLKKIPFVEYLDFAICFYYAYQGEILGNGSILIHNTHLELWKTTKEELFELAKNNTPRVFPCECNAMEIVVKEMMVQQKEQGLEMMLEESEQQEFFNMMPMQILSNQSRVQGAACILYPNILKQLAKKEGKNLFIIPSSIHEVILLPDSGQEDAKQLQRMVAEVNATQVEPEEILSNNLYYYNRLLEQITII